MLCKRIWNKNAHALGRYRYGRSARGSYFTLVEPLALPMRPLTFRIPRLSLLLSVASLGLARTLVDPNPLFMALGVFGGFDEASSSQSGSSYISCVAFWVFIAAE